MPMRGRWSGRKQDAIAAEKGDKEGPAEAVEMLGKVLKNLLQEAKKTLKEAIDMPNRS